MAALQARAANGERAAAAAGAVWIHYPDAIAGSKLSPLLIERPIASPATSRNWRTVATLVGLKA